MTTKLHLAAARRFFSFLIAASTFLVLGSWFVGAAGAASITVDSEDAVDPGSCTLVSAIAAAENQSNVEGCVWGGEAKIFLPAGTYRVGTQINIQEDLEISGGWPGATLVRDHPSLKYRFFMVDGADLVLKGLTLDGGDCGNSGCAVYVHFNASLTADRCTFSNNVSTFKGGAIGGLGDIEVIRSTFHDNSAAIEGGAIWSSSGDLDVELSTFSANSANRGGAIYRRAGAGNITFSTFKDNTAGVVGGGTTLALGWQGSLTIGRSALVDGADDLCSDNITSSGDNVAVDDSCGLTSAGDLENQAVELSELVDHGGHTKIHVPREVCDANGCQSSPLFDRVDCASECPNSGNCIADQRNQTLRYNPLGSNGPVDPSYPATGDKCDVGSYESSCNSVYWLDPVAKTDKVVRLYSSQTSGESVILDNGDCYQHPIDFDSNAGSCTIKWEFWSASLDVTDIHFITMDCPVDCFEDPAGCVAEESCQAAIPPLWSPRADNGNDFKADISCDPGSFRYVIEYEELSAPGDPKYWDPRGDNGPPPPPIG